MASALKSITSLEIFLTSTLPEIMYGTVKNNANLRFIVDHSALFYRDIAYISLIYRFKILKRDKSTRYRGFPAISRFSEISLQRYTLEHHNISL